MNKALSQLDTGIEKLPGSETIDIENLPLPEDFKTDLIEELDENEIARIHAPENKRYQITKKQGQLKVDKLVSYHNNSKGDSIHFEINQESDGAQRIIDLLPIFVDLTGGCNKVFFIDEIDRSLHTLITQELLYTYLLSCNNETRSQLIFTTHDVMLMDQRLFRRDEMWVTEREPTGCTTLFSFSDYKNIRYDKNIRKSYLEGRLGGIPRILLTMKPGKPKRYRRQRTRYLMGKGRRQFKRPSPYREYRRLFVIATEGDKTEPEYFRIFIGQANINIRTFAL